VARTNVHGIQGPAQDKILRLPGRAELPLCPGLLGGAAAPPSTIRDGRIAIFPNAL
jgi:hypothetical protein